MQCGYANISDDYVNVSIGCVNVSDSYVNINDEGGFIVPKWLLPWGVYGIEAQEGEPVKEMEVAAVVAMGVACCMAAAESAVRRSHLSCRLPVAPKKL